MTVLGLILVALGFLLWVAVLLVPGNQFILAFVAGALMGYGIVTVITSRRAA